jgi:LacI family transcriptional regulator
VDNPFSASLNRAVESVASTRHTAVFAASFNDDADRERELVDAFTRRRVDGLILTTITADHGYLQPEREQGMPIVFVDRPPVGLAVDAVLSNNYEAAYQATQHLIDHGHRRIAHLGDELAISTARERQRGFTDAMVRAGLTYPLAQRHIDNLRSEQEAYAAVQRVLRLANPPTALFTSQNVITIGAIRALHHLGRQNEVALIGFDDLTLADLLEPGLTVVAQDPVALGRRAAELVFDRLDGYDGPARSAVIPTTLIARGSGELPPPPADRRAQ